MRKTIALVCILFGGGIATSVYAADHAIGSGQPNLNQSLPSNRLQTTNSGHEKVNINIADVESIANAVKGIGIKRARAIVAYRDANGLFKAVEDIAQVKGISAKFVKNRQLELNEKFTV